MTSSRHEKAVNTFC